MANNSYLIELNPLGNYFFGSENTFTSRDKATNNSTVRNYLVRSRKYPQQTTLLGILRYLLLMHENKLNDAEKNGWDKLIGDKSFMGVDDGAPEKWGVIEKIFPLFIKRNNDLFWPAGIDYQKYLTNTEHRFIVQKIIEKAEASGKELYCFGGYDNKRALGNLWMNNKGELISEQEIFISEIFQVGINKSFEGKTQNDALYKQYFFRLKEGFSFAFITEMNFVFKRPENEIIITSGADQSLFNVKISEQKYPLKEQPLPSGPARISLISDAYVDQSILDDCVLAITSAVDFRYLISDQYTKRYYNIGKKKGDMDKSGKLNLLQRGSVLITHKPEIITDALKKPSAYRNSGFNQYEIESINL